MCICSYSSEILLQYFAGVSSYGRNPLLLVCCGSAEWDDVETVPCGTPEAIEFYEELEPLRSHLRTLCEMNVEITVVWIPGHCGIPYHADHTAKKAIKTAYHIPNSELSFIACKNMIYKRCKTLWKTRWNRATIGRVIYDLVPNVGIKHKFSVERCCVISYIQGLF